MTKAPKTDKQKPLAPQPLNKGGRIPRFRWPDVIGVTGRILRNAPLNGVPLHVLQKWLGHAQLSTTAIYADAVGKEEQDIAARMWS